MANKWKYSALSADERIEKIRNGDREVYDAEVARALDVIDSRKKLGMDISEQKDWIDTVSYNYNISNASKMGIDASSVNKTGYADLLLGSSGTSAPSGRKPVTITGRLADFRYEAGKLYDEYLDKAAQAEKERENIEEWLANNGIDKDGGEGKKYLKEFERSLAEVIGKLKNEYVSKLNSLAAKF